MIRPLSPAVMQVEPGDEVRSPTVARVLSLVLAPEKGCG